jgi:transcriptional regulator with XRE-family HTH domain
MQFKESPPIMSKSKAFRTQMFTTTLQTFMERNGINQVEMCAATGIAVSRINNYLHGKYRTIRPDHLALLAQTAGRTAAERGEMIRAYLLDLLPEALQGEISIETAADRGRAAKRAPVGKTLLPSTTAAALADLQSMSVRSAKARSRTQWFAEILREIHQQG